MTQIRMWSGFSVSSRQMDAGMVHKAGKQTHKLLLCRWHTSLPSCSSRPGKAEAHGMPGHSTRVRG